nr:hypothetical protein [Candidatus Dependentiae bacterium]
LSQGDLSDCLMTYLTTRSNNELQPLVRMLIQRGREKLPSMVEISLGFLLDRAKALTINAIHEGMTLLDVAISTNAHDKVIAMLCKNGAQGNSITQFTMNYKKELKICKGIPQADLLMVLHEAKKILVENSSQSSSYGYLLQIRNFTDSLLMLCDLDVLNQAQEMREIIHLIAFLQQECYIRSEGKLRPLFTIFQAIVSWYTQLGITHDLSTFEQVCSSISSLAQEGISDDLKGRELVDMTGAQMAEKAGLTDLAEYMRLKIHSDPRICPSWESAYEKQLYGDL